MSWHYLPEMVAESLGVESLDTASLLLSKSINSVDSVYFKDNLRATLTGFQFGTIQEPLMENLGVDLWMLYLEDSRAKDSAEREVCLDNMIQEIVGLTLSESFAKWDQDSYSWKTYQDYDISHISEEYLEIWPVAGTIFGGLSYKRPKSVLPIVEPDYGFLPTPTASDYKGANPDKMSKEMGGNGTEEGFARVCDVIGGTPCPTFNEWMMGWPIGWTDSQPLATAKFQQWWQAFGES